MTPSGLKLNSRAKALQFMLANQMKKEEVDNMRAGFLSEGWKLDEKLPKDWMYKWVKGGKKRNICIMTARGTCFNSFKSAKQHLREIRHKGRDLKIFEDFVTSLTWTQYKICEMKLTGHAKLFIIVSTHVSKEWMTERDQKFSFEDVIYTCIYVRLPSSVGFPCHKFRLTSSIFLEGSEGCSRNMF